MMDASRATLSNGGGVIQGVIGQIDGGTEAFRHVRNSAEFEVRRRHWGAGDAVQKANLFAAALSRGFDCFGNLLGTENTGRDDHRIFVTGDALAWWQIDRNKRRDFILSGSALFEEVYLLWAPNRCSDSAGESFSHLALSLRAGPSRAPLADSALVGSALKN